MDPAMISKSLNSITRYLFLFALSLFFFLPLLAMARFAFQTTPVFNLSLATLFQNWTLDALRYVLADNSAWATARLSLTLSVLTILVTFLILLPIATYVELFAPNMKPYLTAVTLLPWLVPPVALVVGVAATFRPVAPWFLSSPYSLVPFYVLWTLPFSYRALDSGLRLMGAKTQYEAAIMMGAKWSTFFIRVIVPNLRTAMLVTAVLSFALVMGEFAFASLLLKQTLPTYLVVIQGGQPRAGFVLALLLMVLSALLLGFLVYALRRRGVKLNATGI
jgi:putative spermidine/putrescine transport system permease protein